MELKHIFQARYGSPKIHDKLINHEHSAIRGQVAVHGTDAHREHLLKDEDHGVVAAALSGGKKEHLDAHLSHPSSQVRNAVAEYGNLGHHLKLMHDKDEGVRGSVGEHSKDEDVLHHLSNDDDPTVRACVAGNKHAPDHVIDRLKEDEHPYVRRWAKTTYAKKRPDEWHAESVVSFQEFIKE